MKPWRAAETSATASGKRTRIASRSCIACSSAEPAGGPDEQAIVLRDAMRVLFPEAVALVSAARQGFMREQ